MKLHSNSKIAVEQFEHIKNIAISNNKDDGSMDLFLLPINGRNFDYNYVSDNLLESVADYALSGKIREQYKDKAMMLSKKAREKFKSENNNGELGELLLFCFLEGYLDAPKILTKLDLKTSNNLYVNGSDGVHLKKISNLKYHLIFGESKTYKKLTQAFENAFQSIHDFRNETNSQGKYKSGINFEKGLISSHIDQIDFDDEDKEILSLLVYPGKKSNSNIQLDDAFSIFIGYEIDISEERRKCSNEEFQAVIKEKIINQIENYKDEIYNLMEKYELIGYTFYIFIMPFTDIDKNRKIILKKVLE